LPAPLTTLGQVKLDLYVASDGLDTDFTAKLLDVLPDGHSMMIGPGPAIVRARYRFGFQREVLFTPGRPTKLVLDLHHVAHTFLAGHRLRIEIASSAGPAFAVNRNTGNPVATDTVWRVARQMIFHDGQRASRLFLPVVPPPPRPISPSPGR
jgi:putative CocE/NonD family hydrolase